MGTCLSLTMQLPSCQACCEVACLGCRTNGASTEENQFRFLIMTVMPRSQRWQLWFWSVGCCSLCIERMLLGSGRFEQHRVSVKRRVAVVVVVVVVVVVLCCICMFLFAVVSVCFCDTCCVLAKTFPEGLQCPVGLGNASPLKPTTEKGGLRESSRPLEP